MDRRGTGLPFLAVFAIGFFTPEIRTAYRSATSVQAGGLAINLREIEDRDNAFRPIIDANTLQNVRGTKRDTPFSLGLAVLAVSTGRVEEDLNKIGNWCINKGIFVCGERNDNLITSLTSLKEYVNKLKLYDKCLNEYYRYYPNGLPIQDELSDIATDMYINDPRLEIDLGRLVEALKGFHLYIEAFVKETGVSYYDGTCDIDKDSVDRIVTIRKSLGDKALPYKSIVESAVIAASGYPIEAGRHLELALGAVNSKGFHDHFGYEEGDFVYFLFATRLLFALDSIHEYNRDHDRQAGVAYKFVSLVEQRFAVANQYGSMPFKDEGLFLDCASGKFAFDEPLMEKFAGSNILSYVQMYFRLFWAVAESPIEATPTNMSSLESLERATEIEEQFSDRISHVRECYRRALPDENDDGSNHDEVESQIQLQRFEASATRGILLARKADETAIDPEFEQDFDQTVKEREFCDAYRTILHAWRIRPKEERAKEAVGEDIVTIKGILRQMNRTGHECEFTE